MTFWRHRRWWKVRVVPRRCDWRRFTGLVPRVVGATLLFVVLSATALSAQRAAAVTPSADPVKPPTVDAVSLFSKRGERAMAQGRLIDAADAYSSAVASDPLNLTLLVAVGEAYLRLNRFLEAIQPLQRAQALMPDGSTGVAEKLALAMVGSGDERSAAAVLRAAGLQGRDVSSALGRLRRQVFHQRR